MIDQPYDAIAMAQNRPRCDDAGSIGEPDHALSLGMRTVLDRERQRVDRLPLGITRLAKICDFETASHQQPPVGHATLCGQYLVELREDVGHVASRRSFVSKAMSLSVMPAARQAMPRSRTLSL